MGRVATPSARSEFVGVAESGPIFGIGLQNRVLKLHPKFWKTLIKSIQ
jgi:hypothetical protein